MGKVKEAVNAWPNVHQEEILDNNGSNLSYRRTSSNDSLMMDLERELFSPISFPESAGYNDRVEQYIEDLTSHESILDTPIIDIPTDENSSFLEDVDCLNSMVDTTLVSYTNAIPSYLSSPTTTTFHPPHAYPPNPISTVIPQQAFSFQNTPLSPLSCGGYIFHQGKTYLPPQTPFVTPFVPLTTGSAPFTETVTPVSSEIASRQEKLDKFRQKRSKRNYNRSDKSTKRIASRDELGHFTKQPKDMSPKATDLKEVKTKLEESQQESESLKCRLLMMEQEMALLKQRAELAKKSQEVAMSELVMQQRMNNSLMLENRLLWTSVPSHEVFCTIKQQNGSNVSKTPSHYLNVKPFEQKIDLSLAAQDLTCTDSRILEAARAEEIGYEKRWEALDFTPQGYC